MLVGPRRIEVAAVPRPEVAPGQVRVAVEGCGVCGSNLPVWEGREWFDYPLSPGEPGHEAWGRVEAVGDEVTGLHPGDPVAILSGDAFAEAAVVAQEDAVPLPEALAAQDFPGEALGCGFNAARRSDFAPGQTVAVVGIGFIGAVMTALAAAAGASVVAVSRRPFSLEIARAMGAAETIALDDHSSVIDRVRDLTAGALCQRVVEAAGAQSTLDLAGELTGVGGRLIIAGYHQDSPRSVDLQLWNWRSIDVVNAHERDPRVVRAGVEAAVAAVASGRLDPSPLYTHRYPLHRLGEAMDAMATRPHGFLKALVTL